MFIESGVVANSKKIYDDRSAEVKELTFIIKKELTGLTQRIGGLRSVEPDGPVSEAADEHRNGVIGLLQGQLADISSRFTQVLQVSSSNMKAQRERREQFGSTAVLPVTQRVRSGTSEPLNGPSNPNPNLNANVNTSTSPTPHVAIEMPFQQLALQEESTALLDSRSTAIQGIEATINELGAIYQQLAHMIAQQGESIQRIDLNIESMQVNVQRGQAQLRKYLRSVSNNRWLMIKMFAVLLLFSIVYIALFSS